MQDSRIRSIVVVGGGVSGWLAAASLAFVLGPQRTRVSVIETPAPPVRGALAAHPLTGSLHARLGVDEADVVKRARGTFTLGVELKDWARAGRTYFHPYGDVGALMDGIQFQHYWLKARREDNDVKLGDYSLAAVAAKRGRFAHPARDGGVGATFVYGLHLDAAQYRRVLKDFAEARSVASVAGEARPIMGENGFIEAMELSDGTRVEGDLFLDCTDNGALIETLSSERMDWSALLPCDRIVEIESVNEVNPPPFTSAAAHEAGWLWRAPLQGQSAHAHVYCSRFLSEDAATATLLRNLDGAAIGAPRSRAILNHARPRPWIKNCVALGDAAGVFEPLESTNLHLLHQGITRLIQLFPDRSFVPRDAEEYNRLMLNWRERARDFLALHYYATQREEPFWAERREAALPEALERKLKMFKSRGHVVLLDEETFVAPAWVSVFIGQNVTPQRYDPQVDNADFARVKANLARMKTTIAQAAESMPTHRAYIDARYRAAVVESA